MLHDHDGKGICCGYAMARAFGFDVGNPECDANTFVNADGSVGIDGSYFKEYTPFVEADVKIGDILEFDTNQHFAYVDEKKAQ